MFVIWAVTEFTWTDWSAVGWTRETAEENYQALAYFLLGRSIGS